MIYEDVVHVSKEGWLTSDRVRLLFADGSSQVLKGNWNIKKTPEEQ